MTTCPDWPEPGHEAWSSTSGLRVLALDIDETHAIAALEGLTLTSDDAAEVRERTDGWPVAIYLALRARIGRDPTERPIRVAASGHRVLHAYMRSELLDPLDAETQRWLMGCGVLHRAQWTDV